MLIPAQPGWRAVRVSAFGCPDPTAYLSIYDVIAWRDDGHRLAPVTAAATLRSDDGAEYAIVQPDGRVVRLGR